MPIHSTDAIALTVYEFGEGKRIVLFMTKEKGKLPVVVKKRRGKRWNYAPLDPLSSSYLSCYMKEGASLCRYVDAEIKDYFLPIREDLNLIKFAACFAEVVTCSLKEYDPQPEIFHLLKNFLEQLPSLKEDINGLSLLFFFSLMKLFRLCGEYAPPSESCLSCSVSLLKQPSSAARLLLTERGGYCPRCVAREEEKRSAGSGWSSVVGGDAFQTILHLNRKSPRGVRHNLSGEEKREIFAYLTEVYKGYTGLEIRTVKVFQEMFPAPGRDS